MSREAAKIELSPDETDELNRWIKSGKTEQRKVERAKIVLRSAEGKPTHQIAKELGTRPTRVGKWRNRFAQLRVPGVDLSLSSSKSYCSLYKLGGTRWRSGPRTKCDPGGDSGRLRS